MLLFLKLAIPDETILLGLVLAVLFAKDLLADPAIRKWRVILPRWSRILDHWGVALVILYLTTLGGWSSGPYGLFPVLAVADLIIDGAQDWLWRG